ncbi:hypothetical protein J4G43_027720 [Bradyrhizobium barranii subsp. barranii]|uniref:Uncharacterized protein n=1 Tax=Bradyrhizobium barranii subsp. barranii TaxID=2823807 RepID=A0A939MF09_9BRAD|nr:hypothetical protein [Bradyrhizobium barranii]UEM08568.1 hypothetical protein J4G43_027720 [Bradyrhizobium barranii subsp. barranii]
MVIALTDTPPRPGINRDGRKAIDRKRLSEASPEVQGIKCADLISNTSTIVKHDPDFAKRYLPEKRAILEVLTRAPAPLRDQAWASLPGGGARVGGGQCTMTLGATATTTGNWRARTMITRSHASTGIRRSTIIEGDVTCVGCGETWSATPAELAAELEHQAAYFEQEERELRRRWWPELFAEVSFPIRWPIFRLLERVWPRKSLVVLTDDEIPF